MRRGPSKRHIVPVGPITDTRWREGAREGGREGGRVVGRRRVRGYGTHCPKIMATKSCALAAPLPSPPRPSPLGPAPPRLTLPSPRRNRGAGSGPRRKTEHGGGGAVNLGPQNLEQVMTFRLRLRKFRRGKILKKL